MQFCWPIMAFGYLRGKICQALGSLAYCLPHNALDFPLALPSYTLVPAACRCSSCLPIRLLAAFRLLACPSGCLQDFFRLMLACPSGCLPEFFRLLAWPSDCLPDPEVACLLLRLLAGFKDCLPSPRAACPPRAIRGIP